MQKQPSVAIAIANFNGAQHLPACLDSVEALDYDGDVETIVVENSSTDGSRELLRDRYPGVRVLSQERNVGFAAAMNVAAAATRADCLALLNNDMRVEPAWLRELVAAYEPASGVPCVSGVILDWEGERVDFVGGFVNFHGAVGQEHFGEPVTDVIVEDGRLLPFPCGGSMLIGRELFLELDGFDDTFFALLEDVDLGWRLRLAGHDVRLAARSRCRHRHNATVSQLPSAERLLLYERNALRMLLKNLGDGSLAPVLAAALLLLAERSALEVGEAARVPVQAVADILRDLDTVVAKRVRVQALRRRSDAEVLAVFGQPFVATRSEDEYLEAAAKVVHLFALQRLFEGEDDPDETAIAATVPVPVTQLIAKWRLELGVDRSAAWHLRRAVWRSLPQRVRDRIRPSTNGRR